LATQRIDHIKLTSYFHGLILAATGRQTQPAGKAPDQGDETGGSAR
jgi:hypothetical protein